MNHVGFVSAEGGPLLVGSAKVIEKWRGIEGGSDDYERACRLFDETPEKQGSVIDVAGHSALVWETGGPGTADVFQAGPGELLLVRAWLQDPDDVVALRELAMLPAQRAQMGSIAVSDGCLVILWATESGECVTRSCDSAVDRPAGEMASEEAGLIVPVTPGSYVCSHESVESRLGNARRCRLVWSG